MERYQMYPPKVPRIQDDESICPPNETRTPSPLESRVTLLKNDPLAHSKARKPHERNASPSNYAIAQPKSWITSLWTAYQKKTWRMYLFLILGTVFAIGHHLFYWNLHGKEAKHQSLMLRYGTILAFCAKASLGSAVIIARRQRVWMVVRHRIARLSTVDSIFTAAEDITALLDWRAIRKAKVATCLAVYVWVTPLIVVLTCDTLSVIGGVKEERFLCPSARTLNFANEETLDWRKGQRIDGYYEMSLSLWNTTSLNPKDADKTLYFDYYASPSQQLKKIVEKVVNRGQAVARENAAQEICTNAPTLLNLLLPVTNAKN